MNDVVIVGDFSAGIPANCILHKCNSINTSAIREAILRLFGALQFCGHVPFEVVTFESLILHPAKTIDSLIARLGEPLKTLPPEAIKVIRDKNRQYYSPG